MENIPPVQESARAIDREITSASLAKEWRGLARAYAVVLVVGAAVIGGGEFLLRQDFSLAGGWLLGGCLTFSNLWGLARGTAAWISGAGPLRSTSYLLGGFPLLLLAGMWTASLSRAWTIGFALGAASPAAAGLLFGLLRKVR